MATTMSHQQTQQPEWKEAMALLTKAEQTAGRAHRMATTRRKRDRYALAANLARAAIVELKDLARRCPDFAPDIKHSILECDDTAMRFEYWASGGTGPFPPDPLYGQNRPV